MESQLTAILNFYAYLIPCRRLLDRLLAQGAATLFERLAQIVQMAQSSGESGWKAFEDNKNRSSVLGSYTDPATSSLRELTYQYHRQGLDQMALSVDRRAAVTQSLEVIKKSTTCSPCRWLMSMFKDALDELVNIYSQGPRRGAQQGIQTSRTIYPTENQRLEDIRKGAETR